MTQVMTLSDHEAEVIEVVRKLANAQSEHRLSSAQGDLRTELESIYHDLVSTPNWEHEEMVSDITRRIYNLLY